MRVVCLARKPPPRVGDQPPLRARDPDPTGGFYRPVRAIGAGPVTIGAVRIVCNLANAPIDAALEHRQRYRPNTNPTLAELTAHADGSVAAFDALPAGRPIELPARWSSEAAETYLVFDQTTQALREQRESLRVSWFVSAGTVSSAHTGRTENDPETSVVTRWEPPPDLPPGSSVFLWTVLRDSRGGASAQHRELRLRP